MLFCRLDSILDDLERSDDDDDDDDGDDFHDNSDDDHGDCENYTRYPIL